MTYPSITEKNLSEGFGQVLIYLNEVTDQWFANMFLIAIYSIVAISYGYAKDDFFGGFAIAGWLIFVVSVLFWLGNFISGITLTIVIAVSIVSVALSFLPKR